jgi:predicted nucleotidyltransferase
MVYVIMKIQNIKNAVEELKSVLVRQFGNGIKIILFGSAARGDTESDIDVLVIMPGAVDTEIEEKVISIAYDIELSLDVVFGIIVHSQEFWSSGLAAAMPFHKNIEREGLVL